MNGFTRLVCLLATLSLGLTSGALLTEAVVLVPFWRSLPPESFLDWYRANAALLFNFFGPLEIVATVLIVLAAAMALIRRRPGFGWWVLACLFAVFVLAAFPLYFREANASFELATIEVTMVSEELERWAAWHWGRTVIAFAAFAAAALGLARRPS